MNTTHTGRRLRIAGATALAATSIGAVAVATDTTPIALAAKATGSAKDAPKPPNPAKDNARLADKLGVSSDKLKSAQSAVRDNELDAAVKAGKLTSRQAELIKELRATGLDFPLPPGTAPKPGSGTSPDSALAKELGVSESKLRDARPAPPAGGPGGKGGPPAPPADGPAGKGGPPAGGPAGKGGKPPAPPAKSSSSGKQKNP